jgi:hypothetical protein
LLPIISVITDSSRLASWRNRHTSYPKNIKQTASAEPKLTAMMIHINFCLIVVSWNKRPVMRCPLACSGTKWFVVSHGVCGVAWAVATPPADGTPPRNDTGLRA